MSRRRAIIFQFNDSRAKIQNCKGEILSDIASRYFAETRCVLSSGDAPVKTANASLPIRARYFRDIFTLVRSTSERGAALLSVAVKINARCYLRSGQAATPIFAGKYPEAEAFNVAWNSAEQGNWNSSKGDEAQGESATTHPSACFTLDSRSADTRDRVCPGPDYMRV